MINFKKLLNKNALCGICILFSFSFCGIDKNIKEHPMKTYPKQEK